MSQPKTFPIPLEDLGNMEMAASLLHVVAMALSKPDPLTARDRESIQEAVIFSMFVIAGVYEDARKKGAKFVSPGHA